MTSSGQGDWAGAVELWRLVRVEGNSVEQLAGVRRLKAKEVEQRVASIDAWLRLQAKEAGEPRPEWAVSRLVHALRSAWFAQEALQGLAKLRANSGRRVARLSGAGREEKTSRQEREFMRLAERCQAEAEAFAATVTFLKQVQEVVSLRDRLN